MKFSANKDGVEQSDGFFRARLQKNPKHIYIIKTFLNFLSIKFIPFLSNW